MLVSKIQRSTPQFEGLISLRDKEQNSLQASLVASNGIDAAYNASDRQLQADEEFKQGLLDLKNSDDMKKIAKSPVATTTTNYNQNPAKHEEHQMVFGAATYRKTGSSFGPGQAAGNR